MSVIWFVKIAKFYFVVPDEIAAIYRELDAPEFHEARRILSWLTRCVAACGKLHAVTPVSVLLEVYARKEPIEEEKLRRLLRAYSGAADSPVYDGDGDRVLRFPMDEEEIQEILDRQGNRDFYIPEPEEVELLYVNEHVSKLRRMRIWNCFCQNTAGAGRSTKSVAGVEAAAGQDIPNARRVLSVRDVMPRCGGHLSFPVYTQTHWRPGCFLGLRL